VIPTIDRRARAAAAVLTVLLTLTGAAVLRPAATGHGTAALADIEDGWRRRAAVPGVVVAVQHGGGRPGVRASGSTLRGGGSPLPADARFRVASITKTFVAVVVLQLVREHRLGLDDAAARHLPGTRGLDGVTIRQLLAHTSGIPEYAAVDEDFPPGLVRDRNRRWSAGELVALATTARPDFLPGTDYHYSNTGYLVLGEVIRAVTGRTWAAEVRSRILDPLGMRDSYVAGAEPGPPVVPGYFDADGDGDEENVETGADWPSLTTSEGAAGALVSTAADLARFAGALFGGRLLDEASLAEMTADRPFHGRGSNYGLGVEIERPDRSTTVLGHGGFLPGFRSTLWHEPATGVTVVVLADDASANTADLAELVLRAVR
jgi:D-alanyl-D-alanine carboxypeptidase